ncbi:uncharacterized protein LOC130719050 [Lotus japonicus]|uniref:uncharacterized protein LOC130719050 n=1 Tax=Lotus japonicus TaxID=34305 RepID=UPI00258D8A52|nr:uncharacterized protein LOC130719050 [Lotus japonicus]
MEKLTANNMLPWDVLAIICKKLNFNDIIQLSTVCKDWRSFLEMKFQSPLIVQRDSFSKNSLSFMSLPDYRFYSAQMDNFWGLSYSGSSSGYLIFAGPNMFLLMNPLTRRGKKISTLALKDSYDYRGIRAHFAFVKGSKEYVLVLFSNGSCRLNVYHSQNSRWATYSTKGDSLEVVDLVVFHNSIYVLTNKAKIGVLNLNSTSIKFLELKNTPLVTYNDLRLVSCDGNLLVVHFVPGEMLNVYKIDFSTMEFVRQDTLGELALFHSSYANCYALSNPRRWGYDSNTVYSIICTSPKCNVYSGNGKLQKLIMPIHGVQVSKRSRLYWVDWYLPYLRDEVDYSLIK